MGTIGQWNYFKVKAEGRMTSSNVKATCEKNGLVNTCVGDKSCSYTTSDCTVTGLTGCDSPLIDISRKSCNGGYPTSCPRLDGVFVYMASWPLGACGVISRDYCADGNDFSNQWALCAERAN